MLLGANFGNFVLENSMSEFMREEHAWRNACESIGAVKECEGEEGLREGLKLYYLV